MLPPRPDNGPDVDASNSAEGRVCVQCVVWYRAMPPSGELQCLACGGVESLHVPRQTEAWHVWHVVFELLVLARVSELDGLPMSAPMWDHLLCAARNRLQLLHRSSSRLRAELPSLPLVADKLVLYAWWGEDSGPLLNCVRG